jgi:hypothetical protein
VPCTEAGVGCAEAVSLPPPEQPASAAASTASRARLKSLILFMIKFSLRVVRTPGRIVREGVRGCISLGWGVEAAALQDSPHSTSGIVDRRVRNRVLASGSFGLTGLRQLKDRSRLADDRARLRRRRVIDPPYGPTLADSRNGASPAFKACRCHHRRYGTKPWVMALSSGVRVGAAAPKNTVTLLVL